MCFNNKVYFVDDSTVIFFYFQCEFVNMIYMIFVFCKCPEEGHRTFFASEEILFSVTGWLYLQVQVNHRVSLSGREEGKHI